MTEEFTFSSEQNEIIKTVLSNKNCLVDAVAGSGKTTTVLGIAQGDITKKIVQITYNKHLKQEVKEKVYEKSISNMGVYTYHGLCVRYYNREAYTDTIMKQVVEIDKKLLQPIPVFDILVIDEAQDMNLLFFQFIRKFLKDYGRKVTIVLLGDENQSINEFRGADRRFLTLGPEIYKGHGEFTRLTLKTSYRLTNQIAQFINKNMLGQPLINTIKEGPKVEYMRTNIWQYEPVLTILMKLLDSKEYKPGDIFVLAGSTRSKRGSPMPLNYLENALVSKNVPCFYSNDEEEELNDKITDGKVVFSTIHQSKGRERPIVIVYGFDSGWFSFFGRTLNREICPPELYVAASRASNMLILLESHDLKPLEFLKDRVGFSNNVNINYSDNESSDIIKPNGPERSLNTNPSDMLRHMNEDIMYTLLKIKEKVFRQHSLPSKDIKIRSSANNTIGTVENVSDLNGLCIPALWEEKIRGTSDIKKLVIDEMSGRKHANILQRAYYLLDIEQTGLSDYLKLTNIYQAINTNCHSKVAQIVSYDWLNLQVVNECHESMSNHIGKDPIFEYSIQGIKYILKGLGSVEINCRLDAVDDNAVWEFKCVKELELEHFIQLIIYAWMWKQPQSDSPSEYFNYGSRKFFLMNIRTEEIHELDTTSGYIDEVVELLLENKYKLREKISKIEFIKQCMR